jgi:hypothetical protein
MKALDSSTSRTANTAASTLRGRRSRNRHIERDRRCQ